MATSVLPEASRACEAQAAPASRASWCGQLKLGTLCVPVKAYAAIATPPEIPLRQLHCVCGERIEYKKCCPQHGEVPAEEIIKGYPYQPDQYVRLTEEERASLQPTDEKTSDLEHFLDPAAIDLVLLAGRSLYLTPATGHRPSIAPTQWQMGHRPGRVLRQVADRRRPARRAGAFGAHAVPSCPAPGLAQPRGRGCRGQPAGPASATADHRHGQWRDPLGGLPGRLRTPTDRTGRGEGYGCRKPPRCPWQREASICQGDFQDRDRLTGCEGIVRDSTESGVTSRAPII